MTHGRLGNPQALTISVTARAGPGACSRSLSPRIFGNPSVGEVELTSTQLAREWSLGPPRKRSVPLPGCCAEERPRAPTQSHHVQAASNRTYMGSYEQLIYCLTSGTSTCVQTQVHTFLPDTYVAAPTRGHITSHGACATVPVFG